MEERTEELTASKVRQVRVLGVLISAVFLPIMNLLTETVRFLNLHAKDSTLYKSIASYTVVNILVKVNFHSTLCPYVCITYSIHEGQIVQAINVGSSSIEDNLFTMDKKGLCSHRLPSLSQSMVQPALSACWSEGQGGLEALSHKIMITGPSTPFVQRFPIHRFISLLFCPM